MLKFKKKKSNLDEMQEQKLLHIEAQSFWVLYLMLAAAIVVQIMMGNNPKTLTGEMLCFMAACAFLIVRCLQNGIWDRRLKPNMRTNLAVSLAAGAVVAVIQILTFYKRIEAKKLALIAVGAMGVAIVGCFILLSICSAIVKKRMSALETETEEKGEGEL